MAWFRRDVSPLDGSRFEGRSAALLRADLELIAQQRAEVAAIPEYVADLDMVERAARRALAVQERRERRRG